MAAAFARRECDRRGLNDVVEIHSAGTDPADEIHDAVVEVMDEVGIDLSTASPTYVVVEDLKQSHYVVTMGCHIVEFNPDHYGVESREWDVPNPADAPLAEVRSVRDEIESRVVSLFDEIEASANERVAEKTLAQRVRGVLRSSLPF
jgi:protein-tyrosine-phosphatase